MKNISAIAELLYVVSVFEKGRLKSSVIWKRKYVRSLKKSLEVMTLLTDLLSRNKEISQEEIDFLQEFLYENNGVIFPGRGNINAFWGNENDFRFLSNDFEDIIKLMNGIMLEIKNLLCIKNKNYKIKIWYLLSAFHNLPRVFLDPKEAKVFNLDIQPITCQEAVQYAFLYLSTKETIS